MTALALIELETLVTRFAHLGVAHDLTTLSQRECEELLLTLREMAARDG